MNTTPLPPIDSPAEDRADREFRAFFRTQLPNPFPPLVLPTDAPEPVKRPARRSLLTRSRIVLAVCVSLVLAALVSMLNHAPSDRLQPANEDGIKASKVKDPLGRPDKRLPR
jgi:hypothetical protein